MEGATHFIQNFRVSKNITDTTKVMAIHHLNNRLRFCRDNGVRTIAIWYIKPKQK